MSVISVPGEGGGISIPGDESVRNGLGDGIGSGLSGWVSSLGNNHLKNLTSEPEDYKSSAILCQI